MKELSIEQKAKRYDDAIERAKEKYAMFKGMKQGDVLEDVFPELKESDDEKIRKEIVKFIVTTPKERNNHKKWLAWLEKQSEQTIPQANERAWLYLVSDVLTWKDGIGQYLDDPRVQEFAKKLCSKYAQKLYTPPVLSNSSNTGKDEPKFHEGEWVVYECGEETATLQITRIVEETYEFSDESTLGVVDEDTLRLWDITKDAKDGDVLAVNNEVFIYAHRKQMYSIAVAHCFVDSVSGFYLDGEFGYTEEGNSIHPATKEQRDTLMKAMTDAGYTFDFEKKELRKLKFRVGDEVITENEESLTITKIDEKGYWSNDLFICDFDSECIWDLVEQKPAWSEEDEEILYSIINDIEIRSGRITLAELKESYTKQIDWLKSLKDRYTWKPSDEQMEAMQKALVDLCGKDEHNIITGLYYDLKKLREE